MDPIPTQATQAIYTPRTWLRHPTLDAKGLGVEIVLSLCPWLVPWCRSRAVAGDVARDPAPEAFFIFLW